MLGKGLESLIPKGGGKPASDNSHAAQPAPQAVPPAVPSNPLPDEEKEKSFSRAFGEAPLDTGAVKFKPARPASGGEAIFQIEVEKIKPNPFQPRRDFNEDSLRELADSIREFGIIQPLIVTKVEKEVPSGTEVEYELIAGERRLMAAKLLGLERVPVIVKRVDFEKERLEMAIIENLQREDLNPLETARAFARLQDEFRLTQREIATRLGKSRETVANTLRLLDLPSYIQDALAEGKISESHGRLLLSVSDKAAQEALFKDLIDRHLTTRELKNRVYGSQAGRPPSEGAGISELPPELKMFQEKLSAELGAPVEIKRHGSPPADGGKITITFYSGEELKGIVERLGGKEEEQRL